jgi:HEAT repeat protein
MKTRTGILIGLGIVAVLGTGNFVFNSIRTNADLRRIAGSSLAERQAGVQSLIGRNVLFDALQGGAPQTTRMNAIAALKELAKSGANPAAFKELILLLKDPDTESADSKTHPVRDAARGALIEIGSSYPELILAAAKDPDTNIRLQSIEALKKIGAPLQSALAAKMGDAAVRVPFGEVLAIIGPTSIPLITPWLAPDKLKDSDVLSKLALIEALGRHKVAEAAQPILRFDNDPDPNVRRAVVTALANIGDPAGAQVLVRSATSPESDASARAAAAGALGGIATPAACDALVSLLQDSDTFVAAAATAGLRRAADRAEIQIGKAAISSDPAVRARAADASGGLQSPRITLALLRDPDANVRAKAAASLADNISRQTSKASTAELTALAAALADPDGTVAAEASSGLARCGSKAIPVLAAALDGNDTAAYQAVRALGTIGTPALDILIKVASASNSRSRWAAVALGEIGNPVAADVLRKLQASPDADTAYVAKAALAKLATGI